MHKLPSPCAAGLATKNTYGRCSRPDWPKPSRAYDVWIT
jgi:hypothetical protein